MRFSVGPYFVFNQFAQHKWCRFELMNDKATCFIWDDARWSLKIDNTTDLVLYTYCPSEQKFLAFVLTKDQALLKMPVFEHQLEDNKPSVRKVSQVFKLLLLETEVRWVPSHIRASVFNLEMSAFPASVGNLSEVPPLPAAEVVSSSSLIEPNATHEESIDVTRVFRRCRGGEFPVSRLLSENQQSFIVQFIGTNGDWPFLGGDRQQQIQLGLALIRGANNELTDLSAMKKYRDPIFLATLMTESFYPSDKKDKGFYATVGNVWCFVNVLLAHGVRLLGHRESIVLPSMPRGYGVSSGEYLSQHATVSNKRRKVGFSSAEQDVHYMVMAYVDDGCLPSFNSYSKREQGEMIAVLRQVILGRALVIDLSGSLLNSIKNLLSLDDESASNYLTLSCEIILNALCENLATLWCDKLISLSPDADCTKVISQLTDLMKDMQDHTCRERILDSLTASHRKLLVDSIAKDSSATQVSQGGIFSVSDTPSGSTLTVPSTQGSVCSDMCTIV